MFLRRRFHKITCWIIFALLCAVVRFGGRRFVYRLTEKWSRSDDQPIRSGVAANLQTILAKFGYHLCPYCTWAMEKPDEHERCRQEILRREQEESEMAEALASYEAEELQRKEQENREIDEAWERHYAEQEQMREQEDLAAEEALADYYDEQEDCQEDIHPRNYA